MAEVLVLVDHADGRLRKATAELLTIARRLGEPVCRARGPWRREGAGDAREVRRAQGVRRRRRRQRGVPRGSAGRDPRRARREGRPCRGPGPEQRSRQGDRRAAVDQDRVGAHHRRGRRAGRAKRRRDDPVGLRRFLQRHLHGDDGDADHRGQAQLGADRGGAGRRRHRDGGRSDQRRGEGGTGHGLPAASRRPGVPSSPRQPSSSPAAGAPVGTSARSRPSPTRSARRSARAGPPSTQGGTRTAARWARPASRCRRSSTSRPASPGRSSTGPACRRRRRSSRSTRTRRRRSSSSSTSASSVTCFTVLPQATEDVKRRKG